MSVSKFVSRAVTNAKNSLSHQYANTSDDWYDKAIEQYRNTPYYDVLASNPHLVRNAAPFAPSAGDKFAEFFGDFSAGDRYYADLHNRAAGYLNDQLKIMREEGYNDASSQAAQMRAAGLNPDLQNVQPGQASENDQPFEPAQMPEAIHPQQILADIASVSMSAYSFASGFAKDMFSFQQMKNAVDSEDLDIYDKIRSSVRDFMRDSAIRPQYDKKSGNWTLERVDDKVVRAFADSTFRNKKRADNFYNEFYRSYNSARNELARITDITDTEGAAKAMNFAVADNMSYGMYYNDGPSSSLQSPIIEVAKSLQDLRKDIIQITSEFQYEKAGYDKDYITRLDAGAAADASNETAKATAASARNAQIKAKVDAVVNKNLDKIISKLESMADQGGLPGVFAQGMLLYYSAFGLQLPSLPALNIGGTTNVTSVKTQ